MRKAMAGGVICLAASVAFAATLLAQSQSKKPASNASATPTNAKALASQVTPLNMKTGLWQTTLTGKSSGLAPQMAAAINPTMTYKVCVTPESLARNEWAEVLGQNKCSSLNVLKSTGTDGEVQAKGCDTGNGITADGHGKVHVRDSGHVTGSIDMTLAGVPFAANGSTVQTHADVTSNWLAATCPAGMH